MMIALELSVDGKRNASNFQNVDRCMICFSSGHVANRQWCREQKMTEYCRESESLTVYHIGVHRCPLKPNTKSGLQVRDAVLRNSGLDACGIQQVEVGQVVAASDIKEAWGRAMQHSYTNIRSEKVKPASERNPDKHSL